MGSKSGPTELCRPAGLEAAIPVEGEGQYLAENFPEGYDDHGALFPVRVVPTIGQDVTLELWGI